MNPQLDFTVAFKAVFASYDQEKSLDMLMDELNDYPERVNEIKDFLKNTALQDCEHKIVEEEIKGEIHSFVQLTNLQSGESVRLSNRAATQGEFRSDVLTQHIDKMKNENVQGSLSEIFLKQSQSVNSNMFKMIKPGITEPSFPGESALLTEGQFTFILNSSYASFINLIKQKYPDMNNFIFLNEEQFNRIWQQMNFPKLHKDTLQLDDGLINEINSSDLAKKLPAELIIKKQEIDNILDEKAKQFNQSFWGHKEYKTEINRLKAKLDEHFQKLKDNNYSIIDYIKDCKDSLTYAANETPLKNMRGFGKIFTNIVNGLIFIANAIFSDRMIEQDVIVNQPDTVQKINALKADLNNLKIDNDYLNAELDQSKNNMPN